MATPPAPRSLPRALRAASPSGHERAVADRVCAYLIELGVAWDEDDAAASSTATPESIYTQLPATNGHGAPAYPFFSAPTPTPFRRRPRSSPWWARTKSSATPRHDPRLRQQGSDRRHARGDAPRGRGGRVARRDRAHLPRHRRSVAPRCRRVRPHAVCARRRATSTTGRTDRRDRARLAARVSSTSGSTVWRPTRACIRRMAARRLRLRRARSRTSASVAWTRRRARTSASSPAGRRGTWCPKWCSFTAKVRSHDERKAVALAREMLESAAFAASLADCEVESEVRPSFPGYRFKESDPGGSPGGHGARASRLRPRMRSGGGAPTPTSSTPAACSA